MNKQQIKDIKRLEYITQIVDAVFAVIYVSMFLYLFYQLKVPSVAPTTDDILAFDYQIFGQSVAQAAINFWMSILALLMMVGIPMLFINWKKAINREFWEYHAWTAGSILTQGLLSLVLFNPFSFVLRIIISRNILIQTTEGGFIVLFKKIGQSIKNVFKKKPADEDEDEALKRKMHKQVLKKLLSTTLLYGFLAIMALFIFIPFYWMILTSLKTYYEANLTNNPRFFISLSEMQWVNYKYVLQEIDFGIYIKNTLIVGVLSTVGTIITTILAAFAFARLDFKGRETIFSVLLMTMMIPGELYIITNFLTVSQAGWGWIGGPTGENQYFLAMIIPFMTSVFYIFFLRQTFRQIPNSLYQAAKVDGSSDFKYLTRVMIPIAAPTLFTITILNVIGSWNAFIWPRLVTSVGDVTEGQSYWLISAALRDADFTTGGTEARVMFNMQIAASAMVTIPLIIVFLALRKYIIKGVGRAGTKG